MQSTTVKKQKNWMSQIILLALHSLVRGYQLFIAPLLGHNCRFLPGCSSYALEALNTHGLLSGLYLTVSRMCRCHPWGGQGFDPVPPPKNKNTGTHRTVNWAPSKPKIFPIQSEGEKS